MNFYKNKKILITGGSKGIGLELTKSLIQNEAFVHSISRTMPSFSHKNLTVFISDLYNEVPKIDKNYDIVILNIGVNPGLKKFDDYTTEEMRRTIYLNLNIHLEILKAVEYKKVAFVNSVLSFVGLPYSSIYCASKSFISAFNESLRREGRDTYIIYPTKVDTDLFSEIENVKALNKTLVAETIIKDLEAGRKTRTLPFRYSFTQFIKLIFPLWLIDWITKVSMKRVTSKKLD